MTSARIIGKTLLFNTLRLGFRLVPMSEAARDRLRQRFLDGYSHLVPPGPSGQPGGRSPRCPQVHSGEPAIGHVAYRREPLPSPLPATLVAFYLPQFHPIAENDQWWGKGFTEWRNVARALPQFEGHAQPRLPADLGFYDLRNANTMREQARLASEYGIGAFCFYFYWFSGKTLLEQPLRQWLEDPSIDLPFCLCWANENWSRRWDGRSDDILIAQQHSAEDDLAFIAHVAAYLRDQRYLRVDGKPLLLVYRPDLLPDAARTAERWRQWCRANAIGEIHLAYVQGFERPDPGDIGFDAAVEFPPNLSNPANLTADQKLLNPQFEGQVLDWRELAADYASREMPEYPLYPGVNAGWDNEPRRSGKGRVYLHASPRRYRDWLQATITTRLAKVAVPDRLVFVNAWNEWAEGAVLEPDAGLGHAWLEATRRALRGAGRDEPHAAADPSQHCAVIHAWHVDAFDELLVVLKATGLAWRLVVTTAPDKRESVGRCLAKNGMEAEIEVLQNRGRDILPFLHVANRLLEEGVDVVLKLHTKRSPHRADGDDWRRELVDRIGSPERAATIAKAFADDPGLGLVGPEGHMQPMANYWGDNADAVAYLGALMGMQPPLPGRDEFIAGSMFWVRLEALRPLLDARFHRGDFEPELGQLDGTLAHAIERIFALAVLDAGYRVEEAASVSLPAPLDATGPGAPGV
ncbi:MAG: glycoside hydrolase family 99-like domain-containing protein [Pseudomonadota bacterium]|nr:glycoside hydrolase family 99-like domain-containing protein [Pseudomonadota bacterium]